MSEVQEKRSVGRPQKIMGKRLKDMSPAELLAHNAALRKASRAREKELKATPIDADDYRLPQAQRDALEKYHSGVLAQIKTELPELTVNYLSRDDYAIGTLTWCSLALTNKWIKPVQLEGETGILAGNYYPDAVASTLIEHIPHSKLLNSKTFASLYRTFLAQVVALFTEEKNKKHLTPEFMGEAKRELARLEQ